ncbi:MAG: hypothetical protein U5N58_09570 [Actinomycetota bacterium]|nr:hypothetical protein [Actinomycetota bacterium]
MTGNTNSITSETLEVAGDLHIAGSSKIEKAMVSIGGNLSMTGDSRINYDLQSPLIVMGDITMEGSTAIGELGKELTLSCQGDINSGPATNIYNTERDDSLSYTFKTRI